MPSIALATCAALPDGWADDALLADALRAAGADPRFVVWDDPTVDWGAFERVVIRSTWDYTRHLEDFLRWAWSLDGRLDNGAQIVEWNSDKRYLDELRTASIPTVPTAFVGAADPEPELQGEVVVKPTVSAGARDTGRFGAGAHRSARELLSRLRGEGRTAMVQPYLGSVDESGETAIVFFAGQPSHVLRKSPVLDRDQEAPLMDDEIGAAKAMYREDLVGPGSATDEEGGVAAEVIEHLRHRFGAPPLYARIDMLSDHQGRAVLLELEAVEPVLYLATAPGSAGRLAAGLLEGIRQG